MSRSWSELSRQTCFVTAWPSFSIHNSPNTSLRNTPVFAACAPYLGPEAVSTGGRLPTSLHHLERGRHVRNGPSRASLQTVFGLRKKLRRESNHGGSTPHFPTGPVAFFPPKTQTQAAHAGWSHLSTDTCTQAHWCAGCGGKHTSTVCLRFLFAAWHLSTSVSAPDNLDRSKTRIACCPRCLENEPL